MPALAKNRSIGPNASSAWAISCTLPSSEEMSATTPIAPSPMSAAVSSRAGQVGNGDPGTSGVEAAGEGGTDAPPGPGDDDMTIREVHGRDAYEPRRREP